MPFEHSGFAALCPLHRWGWGATAKVTSDQDPQPPGHVESPTIQPACCGAGDGPSRALCLHTGPGEVDRRCYSPPPLDRGPDPTVSHGVAGNKLRGVTAVLVWPDSEGWVRSCARRDSMDGGMSPLVGCPEEFSGRRVGEVSRSSLLPDFALPTSSRRSPGVKLPRAMGPLELGVPNVEARLAVSGSRTPPGGG